MMRLAVARVQKIRMYTQREHREKLNTYGLEPLTARLQRSNPLILRTCAAARAARPPDSPSTTAPAPPE